MCTLILGIDVVAPGSVLLAANRDEDPGRPADPPGVLSERPRLIGGRDRRAGGTWLAVREQHAVVALLNRRDRSGGPAPPVPGRRSRGALVLDVASASPDEPPPRGVDAREAPRPSPTGPEVPGLALGALRRAIASCQLSRYSPCSLVFASPEASWWMALEGDAPPRFATIPPGWHALTHADLDDPAEPRTARLVRELAGFAPGSRAEAEQRLDALLASHGDEAAGLPPVCLHHGRMVTVSSSAVWLGAGAARYRHAEGRPCEHPLADLSALLAPANLGSPSPNRPR